jgi:hypothetical protein
LDTKIDFKKKFKIIEILIVKFSLNLATLIYIDNSGLLAQLDRAQSYGRWAYANRTKCDLWLIPTVLSRFSLAKIKILVGRIHEGYMVLIPCLFYCVGITPMSFTKQKWLLVLENANAFSRNLVHISGDKRN